jgi:WD40 repeat protein
MKRFSEQPAPIGALTFDPQEELLAATFQNNSIKIWNLEDSKGIQISLDNIHSFISSERSSFFLSRFFQL